MAPSLRITLALLGITGLGLVLCAAVVFGSLDRLSLRTAEDNVDFLLTQLRDTVEANVGLGIPLANARVVQNLVERAKAADERVLAVEVFSPAGVSLFNTDRGSIGEAIPSAWQNAVRNRIVNDRWRVEELADIVVGEAIRNDFGEPVGYLAMTISGETRDRHAAAVLAALAGRSAIVLPAALAVVLLVAMVALERSSRDVAELATQLEARPPAGLTQDAGLVDLAGRVHASVDRAVQDFEQVTAEVLKADDA